MEMLMKGSTGTPTITKKRKFSKKSRKSFGQRVKTHNAKLNAEQRAIDAKTPKSAAGLKLEKLRVEAAELLK